MEIRWEYFRFPFDDERWVGKAAVGIAMGLLGFLIFPLLFLTGFGLRVMRRVIQGEPLTLPDWDDWGGLLTDGVRAWVVGLVYGLPAMILACCAFGAWAAGFVALMGGATGDAPGLATSGIVLGWGIGSVLFGIMMIIALPLAFLQQVALTRMIAHDSLNSAFEFGEVWRLTKAGLNNYLLAFAVYYGGTMLISMVGSILSYTIILSCLYPLAMLFLAYYGPLLMGALFGAAYRETQTKLEAGEEQAEAA
jgi:hypothetical protein